MSYADESAIGLRVVDHRSGKRRWALPSHIYCVHFALFLTQMCFGGAAIVGKIGIHGVNPLLFAFLRESAAGSLFSGVGRVLGGKSLPDKEDIRLVCGTGLAIFVNQLFYILGLKFGDPVSGAAWQPAQPIFTTTLAIFLGLEAVSLRKLSGIFISVAGAVFMVLHGSASMQSDRITLGHLMFFFNCAGASCYVILSKKLLKKYPPASVIGWSYTCASILMFLATAIVNSSEELLSLVCLDEAEHITRSCMAEAWHISPSMLLPLLYYVLLASLMSYFFLTWANQFANASVVSAYTVVQPLTCSGISTVLIAIGGHDWATSYGLRATGTQDLGVVAILIGLYMLFSEPTMQSSGGDDNGSKGAFFDLQILVSDAEKMMQSQFSAIKTTKAVDNCNKAHEP